MLRLRSLLSIAPRALSVVVMTCALLFPSASALAQGFTVQNTGLTEAGQRAGYNVNQECVGQAGGCIPYVLGQVVSALLGAVGALFLVLILYGGVQYMTAGGNEKKVTEATQTIRNAILGMLVIAAAYAITQFVFKSLETVTSGETVQE